MRLVVLATATLLALTALSITPASAQPGLAPPGQATAWERPPTYVHYQPETTTTAYGWQVFAADAASWALFVSTVDGANDGLATVGAMGMFFGGPAVHLAQGNTKGAGYSLLARTALPLAGGLLGAATCDESEDDWGCLGSTMLGVTLGYGTALVIDYFHLAKKTKVTTPPRGWASLRPSLQVKPTGAQAGVAINF